MTTTISSILIEALARRAKHLSEDAVSRSQPLPTVPQYKAAFVDELARFDNSSAAHSDKWPCEHCAALDADYMRKGPPKQRAKLIPDASQSSLGKGIGQQTGGTAQSDAEEVRRIMSMLEPLGILDIGDCCGRKVEGFLLEMRKSYRHPSFAVTGKQLFYLRDVLSKLVERGVL